MDRFSGPVWEIYIEVHINKSFIHTIWANTHSIINVAPLSLLVYTYLVLLLTVWKYTVQVPHRPLPALVFVARHFPVASVTF